MVFILMYSTGEIFSCIDNSTLVFSALGISMLQYCSPLENFAISWNETG